VGRKTCHFSYSKLWGGKRKGKTESDCFEGGTTVDVLLPVEHGSFSEKRKENILGPQSFPDAAERNRLSRPVLGEIEFCFVLGQGKRGGEKSTPRRKMARPKEIGETVNHQGTKVTKVLRGTILLMITSCQGGGGGGCSYPEREPREEKLTPLFSRHLFLVGHGTRMDFLKHPRRLIGEKGAVQVRYSPIPTKTGTILRTCFQRK